MLLKLQFVLHFSTRTPSYASVCAVKIECQEICRVQTVNFKCRLCDKTFHNSDELETHLAKMHTKKTKLYVKCDQCDSVTDNILSHEASKVCQYCDFVIKDKKDLKDHEIMVIT